MHALKEDTALQTTNLLQELAASMCSKFEKYWDLDEGNHTSEDIPHRRNKEIAFNLALVIAIVLDPRKKKHFIWISFFRRCAKPRSDWYACELYHGVDEKVLHIV